MPIFPVNKFPVLLVSLLPKVELAALVVVVVDPAVRPELDPDGAQLNLAASNPSVFKVASSNRSRGAFDPVVELVPPSIPLLPALRFLFANRLALDPPTVELEGEARAAAAVSLLTGVDRLLAAAWSCFFLSASFAIFDGERIDFECQRTTQVSSSMPSEPCSELIQDILVRDW